MLSLLHLSVTILTILAYFVYRYRLFALGNRNALSHTGGTQAPSTRSLRTSCTADKPLLPNTQTSDKKEQEYVSAMVRSCPKMGPQKGRKSNRQGRQRSSCRCSESVVEPSWTEGLFPRHKTDPRIFVDNEEIGKSPMD